MAIDKVEDLKTRIREALRSDDFQRSALGLSGATLSSAIVGLFRKNKIRVELISVAPADKAALADFAAVWKSSLTSRHETNWFSLKGAKR